MKINYIDHVNIDQVIRYSIEKKSLTLEGLQELASEIKEKKGYTGSSFFHINKIEASQEIKDYFNNLKKEECQELEPSQEIH